VIWRAEPDTVLRISVRKEPTGAQSMSCTGRLRRGEPTLPTLADRSQAVPDSRARCLVISEPSGEFGE